MNVTKLSKLLSLLLICPIGAFAAEIDANTATKTATTNEATATQSSDTPADTSEKKIDMSDPMAIYTSVGAGYGSNGANLKMSLSIPSKIISSMMMIEAKDAFNHEPTPNQYMHNEQDSSDLFENYRIRYFATTGNPKSLKPFSAISYSIDSTIGVDTKVNTYNIGVLTNIPMAKGLITFYPGIYVGTTRGGQWAYGNHWNTTTATAQIYSRWRIPGVKKLSFMVNYNYTKSIDNPSPTQAPAQISKSTFQIVTNYQITKTLKASITFDRNGKTDRYGNEDNAFRFDLAKAF